MKTITSPRIDALNNRLERLKNALKNAQKHEHKVILREDIIRTEVKLKEAWNK